MSQLYALVSVYVCPVSADTLGLAYPFSNEFWKISPTWFINPDNVWVCDVTCGEGCKFCRPSLCKILCVVCSFFLFYSYRLWRNVELWGWRSRLQLHVGRKPNIPQTDLLPLKIWGFHGSADCYCDLSSRGWVVASRAMKSVEGSRSTDPLIRNFSSRRMWVAKFTPRPLYVQGRAVGGTFCIGDLLGCKTWSGRFGEQKNLLPSTGSEPKILRPVA